MISKRVLILGGTKGLGQELAKLWRVKKHDVTTIGRADCDLGDSKQLESYLSSLKKPYDTIVYCAGVSAAGKVLDVPTSEFRRCYEINFFAPLSILKHFLSLDTPPTSFVLVLSGVAEVFFPGLSPYSLSKRALRDLLAFLKMEGALRKTKIFVVYPGGMKTTFNESTALHGIYQLPKNVRVKEPAVVAKKIIARVEAGRAGVIGCPLILRCLGFLQSFYY